MSRSSLQQPVVAGVVTALVGFTSSFAVVLAGLRSVGATDEQAASGLLALCVVFGILMIVLSLWTRLPLTLAWSTPGAALLVTTGTVDGGWSAAVGAFAVTGVLLAATGAVPWLGRLIARIPVHIARAMLAGVLLSLCLEPFTALQEHPWIVGPVVATWLLAMRFVPRWAVPIALVVAFIGIGVSLHDNGQTIAWSDAVPAPTWTTPTLTWAAVVGIALPLTVVTVTSQNIPGVAVMRSFGFEVPWTRAVVATGAGTLAAAPLGGHAMNLAAISASLAAGEEAGPRDRRWIAAFLDKVPVHVCNKRVLDSLIRAGAFDSLGHGRRALTTIADDAVDQYIDLKRNAAIGQDSLFGGMDDEVTGLAIQVPQVPEWEKAQLLAFERDMLGLYVSDHPLLGLEHVLKASSDCTIGQLIADTERADGSTVRICGLITTVSRRMSKKGDTWALVTIEDLEGAVDVMVFPAAYQLSAPVLLPDTVVVVKGRVRRTDDGVDLNAMEVTMPAMSSGGAEAPVVVTLPVARCTSDTIGQFKQVLGTHPGMTEVHLRLVGNGTTKVMRLDDSYRVKPSSSLIADLKELLGPHCLA